MHNEESITSVYFYSEPCQHCFIYTYNKHDINVLTQEIQTCHDIHHSFLHENIENQLATGLLKKSLVTEISSQLTGY